MNWYAKTNELQGMVFDEKTGETIAVSYKPDNAQLIASAPKLLEMLKQLLEVSDLHTFNHMNMKANRLIREIEEA